MRTVVGRTEVLRVLGYKDPRKVSPGQGKVSEETHGGDDSGLVFIINDNSVGSRLLNREQVNKLSKEFANGK
jgi:hypothetical protein